LSLWKFILITLSLFFKNSDIKPVNGNQAINSADELANAFLEACSKQDSTLQLSARLADIINHMGGLQMISKSKYNLLKSPTSIYLLAILIKLRMKYKIKRQ